MPSRTRHQGGQFAPLGSSHGHGYGNPATEEENEDGGIRVDPTWAKKSHRQRRFTYTTRPELHEAEQEAMYEAQNWTREDVEIEGLSQELEQKLWDMDEGVKAYAEQKEREAYLKSRFDENGKPIPELDAEGNEIPFDEDMYYEYEATFGYPPGGGLNAMPSGERGGRGPGGGFYRSGKGLPTINLDPSKIKIMSGWLHKKGSGESVVGRRNWKRRYFVIDEAQPTRLYYYKSKTSRQPQGIVRIDGTATNPIDQTEQKIHSNKNVKSQFMFHVQHPSRRTFQVYADDEQSMAAWILTLRYISEEHARVAREHEKLARQNLRSREDAVNNEMDAEAKDEAQNMTARGEGLFDARAGADATFVIQANDQYGNPDPDMIGLPFSATLESDKHHFDLNVVDLNNGTYAVTYAATEQGEYTLSVMLRGCDIYGSPFHPVVAAPATTAYACVAAGAGLKCAVHSAVNTFTIQARSMFDRPTGSTDDKFIVAVSRPGVLVEGSPRSNGDGTYTVSYLVRMSPDDMTRDDIGIEIDVRLEGGAESVLQSPSRLDPQREMERRKYFGPPHIKGSPFVVRITPALTSEALIAAQDAVDLRQNAKTSAAPSSSLVRAAQSLAQSPPSAPVNTAATYGERERQMELQLQQYQQHGAMSQSFQQQQQQSLAATTTTSTVMQGGTGEMVMTSAPAAIAHEQWAASPSLQAQPITTGWAPQGREAGAVVESLRDRERQIQREREELLRMKAALAGPSSMSSPVRSAAAAPVPFLSTSAVGSRSSPSSRASKPASDDASVVESTFGAESAAMFARYDSILRQVYSHFDSNGVSSLSMPDLVRMARDYDITPTFISRKEIRDAYESALGGKRGGLSYGRFLCALGHVASISLSKPMFTHLYKSHSSKVNVLLTMWGVGDSSKLSEIRNR